MTVDLERLRSLALSARSNDMSGVRAMADLGCQYDAILALLAERDALVRERDEAREKAADYHRRAQQAGAANYQHLKALERAQGVPLSSFARALTYGAMREAERERDALAADAQRYRWLTTRVRTMSPRMDGTFEHSLHLPSSMRAESFDAAVDAAIAALDGAKE